MNQAFQILLAFLAWGEAAVQSTESVSLNDYESCGVNCLVAMARLQAISTDTQAVRRLMGSPDQDGCNSLEDLNRTSLALGMTSQCIRLNPANWKLLPTPAIVQLVGTLPGKEQHFVIVLRVDDDSLHILDPPAPHFAVAPSKFIGSWSGYALAFSNDASVNDVRAAQEGRRKSFRNMRIFWSVASAVAICALVGLVLLQMDKRNLEGFGRIVDSGKGRVRIGIGMLCVGISVLLAWSVFAVRPPRLQLEKPVLDLGDLKPGEHNISFEILNAGGRTLTLGDPTTTCSCASIGVMPVQVEPAESQSVQVSLTVGGGPKVARIEIPSNDPSGPTVLTLAWRGAAPGLLVPPSILVERVSGDGPYERLVSLVYPGGFAVDAPVFEGFKAGSKLVHFESLGLPASQIRDSGTFARANYVGSLSLRLRIDRPANGECQEIADQCLLHFRSGGGPFSVRLPITVQFCQSLVGPENDCALFTAKDPADLLGQVRGITIPKSVWEREIDWSNLPNWIQWTGSDLENGDSKVQFKIVGMPPRQLSQFEIQMRHQDGRSLPIFKVKVFHAQDQSGEH